LRLASALFFLLTVLAAGQTGTPRVEFLHLTDTHVVDLGEVAAPLAAARKHFAPAGAELAKFLAGSSRPPGSEFVLITGDLVDGFSFVAGDGGEVYGQIDAFQRAIRPSPVPIFLLLGNHDLSHYGLSAAAKPAADQSVAGEARAAWTAAAPCFRTGTYYAIEKQVGETRYVILMLDNGYAAAGAKDASGFRPAHEQLYWIRRQLESHPQAAIVLALHVPLGADAGSQAIKGALAGAGNIALILGGHNHRDQIDEVPLGGSAAVQVRTAAFGYGVNNWRRICLHPDRIEVFATGKLETVEKLIPIRRGK
jgi:predicted MPP superfamily phosphohydrolase